MHYRSRWLAAVLILPSLGVSACTPSEASDSEAASDEGPAKIEPVKGTDVSRVVLTAKAAQRLGIQTATIRSARVTGDGTTFKKVVPYAAVMYGPAGNEFVFTSPAPLVFVRRPIRVRDVDGDRAVLISGPPVGTAVVTVGAAELLGTEYGVEE